MFSQIILPIQSVGVQGDNRTYRSPMLLKGEFSSWENLGKLSTNLTNNNSNINRVFYEIIDCNKNNEKNNYKTKKSTLTKDRISLLQDIDYIVEQFQIKHGLLNKIWQFPVVLIPISNDGTRESIVLRPIESDDAMTANFYQMDFDLLQNLVKEILQKHGDKIESVFYDITNKPPGTIEWE